MKKKISKIMVAAATAVMSVGLATPLISCTNSKLIAGRSFSNGLEIKAPESIALDTETGGTATFYAIQDGKDVTRDAVWSLPDYPQDAHIIINSGKLEVTASWARLHSSIVNSLKIRAVTKTGTATVVVPIAWQGTIEFNYSGPKEFFVNRFQFAWIQATKDIKITKHGQPVSRDQYDISIVNKSVDDDEKWNIWFNPDTQEIKVKAGNVRYQDVVTFDFKVVDHLTGREIYNTGWKITAADRYIEVVPREDEEGSFDCDTNVGFAGQCNKTVLVKVDHKEVPLEDLDEFKLVEGEKEPTNVWYDAEKKTYLWNNQLPAGNKVLAWHAEYTLPDVKQKIKVTSDPILLRVFENELVFKGDKDFNTDTCEEFETHKWSKNISLSWGGPHPMYSDLSGAKVTVSGDNAPKGLRVESKFNEEKKRVDIELFIDSEDNPCGEYNFKLNASAHIPGVEKEYTVSTDMKLTLTAMKFTVSGYNTQLLGDEYLAGNDDFLWSVILGEGKKKQDVTQKCTFTIVKDPGSDDFDTSQIEIKKGIEGVQTTWNQLPHGSYLFHVKVDYNGKRHFEVNSEQIFLHLWEAQFIAGVPTEVYATEWTAGYDLQQLQTILAWEDGSQMDCTDRTTWEIETEGASNVFSISDDKYLTWNSNINRSSPQQLLLKASCKFGKTWTTDALVFVNITDAVYTIIDKSGDDTLTADLGSAGQSVNPWQVSLSPGEITSSDKIHFKLVDVPDAIKGKVHINDNGIISWDNNLPATKSDTPYKFKIQSTLEKSGRSEPYTSNKQEIKLFVRGESQKMFENMSWETLTSILSQPNGLEELKKTIWLPLDHSTVGLTKTIKMKIDDEDRTYTVRVIGEAADALSLDHSQKAPLTFEFTELTGISDAYDDNSNIWNDEKNPCHLRTVLIEKTMDALPEVVKKAVRTVRKESSTADGKTAWHDETIFLPSATELGANKDDPMLHAEGTVYSYYTSDAPSKRIKKIYGQDDDVQGIYWTRSAANRELRVCCVYAEGLIDPMNIYQKDLYVAPCFCL